MTPLSWLYMGLVWTAILTLNVYCFYRIFTKESQKKKGNEE